MSQEKWGQGRGLGGISLSLHECTVKSNVGSALMDSKMINKNKNKNKKAYEMICVREINFGVDLCFSRHI